MISSDIGAETHMPVKITMGTSVIRDANSTKSQ